MNKVDFTRRGFLGATAASTLFAAGVMPARAVTTVGFIYVGPRDDYGWNQAHAVAAAALKDDARHQGHRGRERAGDRRGLQTWNP